MRRTITIARVVVAGALTGAVVAFALGGEDGSAGSRAASAVLHGLQVAVPAAVGILVLARRPRDRFARLLYATGLAWSLLALTDAPGALPYSIGRVAYWLVEPTVIFLLLAFPSGRLRTAAERLTFGATAAVVAVLYLPTALLDTTLPVPLPGATCDTACPDNALAVTSSTPAFVDDVMRPLRETLISALFVVVVVILVRRVRAAGPLMRRALVPVAAIAALRLATFVPFLVARAADPSSGALDITGWVFMLSLPLIAVGFGGGLLARSMYGSDALRRLARALGPSPGPAELQAAMAETLEDPTLRILYWRPEDGLWVDSTGWPVVAPERGLGVEVTKLRADGVLLGAIVHDAGVAHDAAVMDTAASFAVIALKNGELVDQLRSSVAELSASRQRITAVADETRRQIERDLHDGAQQRLIALRIKLALESERLRGSDPGAAATVAELGDQAEQAIDEVRRLARGIYPSLLADRGLAEALAEVARASPVETTVAARHVGRYPAEIESAVYFACVEAVQNAAKHARGAQHIAISLSENGALRFEVADDGTGPDGGRVWLPRLRDRIRAVGGELAVASAPHEGTRLRGSVPVA